MPRGQKGRGRIAAPLRTRKPCTGSCEDSREHGGRLPQAAFAVLGIYLLSPALTSVHVEGFTAQIQIGAIAANAGLLNRANLLYPLHAEYFYLTREGVVFLLQPLMAAFGTTGDIVFRVMTGLSFALFVGSTVVIARRQARVGLLAVCAALLMTPGIAELPFYFNDNVVSVAFGMLGIALLPAIPGLPGVGNVTTASRVWILRAVLAGASLGLAIMARPDAVLLLPVVAGFGWLDAKSWRALVLLGAVVTAAILAVFVASYFASGTTLIQAVQIGRYFDHLQSLFRHDSAAVLVFILFFGLPNLALLPIGAFQELHANNLKRILVLVVLPIVLLAYMVPNAMETRQFYPILAPFIAIHGARGLEWLGSALTSGQRARVWKGAILAAGIALVWVAPPVYVPVRDGPRAVVGRLWSPILWFQWQRAVTATLDDVAALVDRADHVPRLVVVTTHFNADHYLRLRLWQRGYRPLRAQEAVPGCVGGFEVWRKGTHELDQVRTENPHFMFRPHEYLEALEIQRAFQCSSIFQDAPVYVSGVGRDPGGNDVMASLSATRPDLASTTVAFGWPRRSLTPSRSG
ncbi:MAG: ArnT family glycosyltransferase [Gemmatimonadaceae bacterium]